MKNDGTHLDKYCMHVQECLMISTKFCPTCCLTLTWCLNSSWGNLLSFWVFIFAEIECFPIIVNYWYVRNFLFSSHGAVEIYVNVTGFSSMNSAEVQNFLWIGSWRVLWEDNHWSNGISTPCLGEAFINFIVFLTYELGQYDWDVKNNLE